MKREAKLSEKIAKTKRKLDQKIEMLKLKLKSLKLKKFSKKSGKNMMKVQCTRAANTKKFIFITSTEIGIDSIRFLLMEN